MIRVIVFAAMLTVGLIGCGDKPPPRTPLDPPAKAEVQLLRQQELAAEKRAGLIHTMAKARQRTTQPFDMHS